MSTSSNNRRLPVLAAPTLSRRDLLFRAGSGFAGLALTHLLDRDGALAAGPDADKKRNPLAVRASHFEARAKSVIFLFMYGGPSQVDIFDPKPELARHHGKPMTGKGEIDVFFGNPGTLMASPYQFKKYGQAGVDVRQLYPNLARRWTTWSSSGRCTPTSTTTRRRSSR